MDWVLNHLQLVITLAILFAGWIAQRRQKETGDPSLGEGARGPTQNIPPPLKTAVPADEQVRRIQEEIRRKIQERAAGPATPTSTPPARPVGLPAKPVAKPRVSPASTVPSEPRRRAIQPPRVIPAALPISETQQAELRRIEALRRETRKVDHAAIQDANAAQAAGTGGNNPWIGELRNAASLRRALILREVLGPPLSLRK